MEQADNKTSLYHTIKNVDNNKYFVSHNKYFVDLLKSLKERIESTNLFHQIEILRIFNDNGVEINENKNGVFINLTYVDSSILDKVYKYLSYVSKQEDQLNEIEKEKLMKCQSMYLLILKILAIT